MLWFKFATYSTDLAYLRDYLKGGLNPYDFHQYLDEYYEEQGGFPRGYVDSIQYMDEMPDEERAAFKEWLEKNDVASRFVADDPSYAPSYLSLDYSKVVPPTTWLVHFSDAADDIASEGFQKGHWDMSNLGYTTHFTKESKEPGWNFAFDANSRDADFAAAKGHYGNEAVMFMSAGVEAYHYGDQEHQIVFWGPAVKDTVHLRRDGSEWYVSSSRDGRTLYQGDFRDVAEWVQNNYQQYRNVLE